MWFLIMVIGPARADFLGRWRITLGAPSGGVPVVGPITVIKNQLESIPFNMLARAQLFLSASRILSPS